jgi:surface antigen
MQGALFRKTIPAALLIAALAAGGCAQNAGQKEAGGAMLGAILGGLLGSQFGKGDGKLATTALGTLAGAAVGSSVGRSMDDVDRMKMRQAERAAYAAPLNETIIWNNPDTGNHGSVTPVRDGRTNAGEYCREFQSEIIVGGDLQTGYGTACRQPDGTWKIVEG